VIALLLAAAFASTATDVAGGPSAPPDIPPQPSVILGRYAAALERYRTPTVLTFEYAIDQTGARDIQQTHRVFRSGSAQRDELLSVDGKRLEPPGIHIFVGHRNRYTVEELAPRPTAYDFRFVGVVHEGHHADYVFATTPLAAAAFAVTEVTIDGLRYLPTTIRFATQIHGGSGVVVFGPVGRYWLPMLATAGITDPKLVTQERITFGRYRFPQALAASTFATPRPLPSFKPLPY